MLQNENLLGVSGAFCRVRMPRLKNPVVMKQMRVD
jgi:hypothetical protein